MVLEIKGLIQGTFKPGDMLRRIEVLFNANAMRCDECFSRELQCFPRDIHFVL